MPRPTPSPAHASDADADEPAAHKRLRLRILFCNWRDTRNPEGGGSEVFVESVARSLAAAGHEVTIACASHVQGLDDEFIDGVRLRRGGSKLGVYPVTFWRLLRGKYGGTDVVIDVQNGVPFLARWSTRSPVVVLVHHVHREQWPVVYGTVRSRIGWWIESWLSPRVNRGSAYVAVSQRTREELVELGVRASDITVVHNGTQPPPPTTSPRSPRPRIVVLGRLVPHKRVENVLLAAADLRVEFPDLEVAIVGDGWWTDELTSKARELGVDDLVRFTGFVDEQDKHEELARAWVLALPSLKEGWGLVVMEAATHGVPSVAYRDAGGVAEAITDGVTGVLVDGGEPEFTLALRTLLRDPELRTAMGEMAKKRAQTFGWSDTADSFAEVLSRATGQQLRMPDPISEFPAVHIEHDGQAHWI